MMTVLPPEDAAAIQQEQAAAQRRARRKPTKGGLLGTGWRATLEEQERWHQHQADLVRAETDRVTDKVSAHVDHYKAQTEAKNLTIKSERDLAKAKLELKEAQAALAEHGFFGKLKSKWGGRAAAAKGKLSMVPLGIAALAGVGALAYFSSSARANQASNPDTLPDPIEPPSPQIPDFSQPARSAGAKEIVGPYTAMAVEGNKSRDLKTAGEPQFGMSA